MGWFGFNGGSALVAGPEAVAAVLASQLACSSSSFIWMVPDPIPLLTSSLSYQHTSGDAPLFPSPY
jgi:ammonia channel protein AmtB